MTMLSAMDRFVHVTRLDVMTRHGPPRPRNLRWLPLVPLGSMAIGYAIVIGAIDLPGTGTAFRLLVSASLFMLGLLGAAMVRLFGPRLADVANPLDEREREIRARAGNISFFVVTLLAMLGCFYAAFAAAVGGWMPRQPIEWAWLGLGFQAAALVLPVWFASWLQPKPDAEDEL